MAQGLQTKKLIKPRDDKKLICRNLLKDFKSSRYISLVNGIVQLKLVISGSNIDEWPHNKPFVAIQYKVCY
jgi:hypothetical protein